jgi:hypothetical protein
MTIDKAYMLPIIHKLVEDIKAKEMDYGMSGLKVQISLNLTEAQILLDALLKSESEVQK